MNFTPQEVADRWKISVNTLANWRVTGCGPRYIKFGRKVIYPLKELEAFEERNLRSATSVNN